MDTERTGQKTILVTGGAGFIGSHLCRALLRRGDAVICLDNYRTGTAGHVADLADDPSFALVEADVTEPFGDAALAAAAKVAQIAAEPKIDEIYHLACPASPVHYREDPIYTARTCFLGALNVLELADACGARVLLTSTSEVYGDPSVHPQKESYRGNVSTVGPRACYDEGKRIAETLFFDMRRTRGVDARVVRIFNTYGPNMEENDGRIVSNFVSQALKNEDITIYGDGSQTRSFCYVDDTVRALLLMMGLKKGPETPVNLGNPEEHSVLDAAKMIIEHTGSQSKITYHPLPVDDPTRRRPDITLAKELLGWSPETPFAEGLDRTIQYFRDV